MLALGRLRRIYPKRKTKLFCCEAEGTIIEISAIVKTGTGKIRTIHL
jgi:hypothetical protein